MANTERKYYTWMDIVDGKDDQKYIFAELVLSRITSKTTEAGKKVVTGAAAISNGDQKLAKALGKEVYAQDGTVWVDVNFWEDRAERFEKFLNGRDKVRLMVSGRLSIREWTTADGKPAQRVQISANNWRGMDRAPATAEPTVATEAPVVVDTATPDCPF